MKKSIALLFLLAAFTAQAQQPIRTTHLSVPAGQQPAITLPPALVGGPTFGSGSEGGNTDTYNQVQQQIMSSNFSTSRFEDYTYIHLPEIDVIFESARNNPMTEYHALRQQEKEWELKYIKGSWLKYINLNASGRYGYLLASYGTEVDPSIDPTMPMLWNYSNQIQWWWSFGAAIVLPFDEIFNKRPLIRKQKAIIAQSQWEAESWYNERKIKIIDAYANAGLCLALIRIKSEAATLAAQQYSMSQADFINGRIGVTELSYAKGIQNTSSTEYEQTRSELYKAIMTLEALSNYKILNK